MKRLLLASACFGAMATSSLAANQDYLVMPTLSDHNGITLNLWFETPLVTGWDRSFRLMSPGMFSSDLSTIGSLTATAYGLTDAASGFDMSFSFDDNFAVAPQFKSLFGVSEPANNTFLNMVSGRLSGFGDLAGLELDVAAYPDPGGASTQIGGGISTDIASNLHNPNFGMSSWFQVTGIAQATCTLCASPAIQNLTGSMGDVVFDLQMAPVPIPASGLLLLGALGLAGFGAKRHRKSG